MILTSACVGVVSIGSWLTTLIAVSSIVTEEYAAETEFDEKKIAIKKTFVLMKQILLWLYWIK